MKEINDTTQLDSDKIKLEFTEDLSDINAEIDALASASASTQSLDEKYEDFLKNVEPVEPAPSSETAKKPDPVRDYATAELTTDGIPKEYFADPSKADHIARPAAAPQSVAPVRPAAPQTPTAATQSAAPASPAAPQTPLVTAQNAAPATPQVPTTAAPASPAAPSLEDLHAHAFPDLPDHVAQTHTVIPQTTPDAPIFIVGKPGEHHASPYGGSGGNGNGGDGGSDYNSRTPRRKPKKEKSPYVTKKFLAVVVALSVIASSILGAMSTIFFSGFIGSNGSYDNLTSNSSLESATGSELTIEQIVAKNADAVVEINTEVTTQGLYGSTTGEGAGSGVIVNKKGYVATNYHVIEGANSITVRLHNNEQYDAQVVGYDQSNDVAVLKINDKEDFTAATLGKSSEVKVGSLAVAIGNPLGQLGGSATSGIISALDRKLKIDNNTLTLLQADCSINPGNSGGGLFNGKGELIGIVVAKGSGSDIEGLGFAIPIDTAAPIIDDIIDNGTVHAKPAAGIRIFDVPKDQVDQYQVDQPGVYIAEVYGENAVKAGVKEGDHIVAFEGKDVNSSNELIAAIQKKKIGDQVTLTVERNGEEVDISFKLEDSSKFANR